MLFRSKEYPKTIALDEVELHKNYALVISTNAGLWRFLIGDTIRFTSKYPFRFRITGRTKLFINAFGEEVIIENTDEAIRLACIETNAAVSDYTVAPVYFSGKENGAHEWLIEFERHPADLTAFTNALDQALKSLNSDYEAKRYRDMALRMPVLKVLPNGTFFSWLKRNGKLGGQHKVPRLSNDRKHVDEILEMMMEHSSLA